MSEDKKSDSWVPLDIFLECAPKVMVPGKQARLRVRYGLEANEITLRGVAINNGVYIHSSRYGLDNISKLWGLGMIVGVTEHNLYDSEPGTSDYRDNLDEWVTDITNQLRQRVLGVEFKRMGMSYGTLESEFSDSCEHDSKNPNSEKDTEKFKSFVYNGDWPY